jgi:hypothetical protein
MSVLATYVYVWEENDMDRTGTPWARLLNQFYRMWLRKEAAITMVMRAQAAMSATHVYLSDKAAQQRFLAMHNDTRHVTGTAMAVDAMTQEMFGDELNANTETANVNTYRRGRAPTEGSWGNAAEWAIADMCDRNLPVGITQKRSAAMIRNEAAVAGSTTTHSHIPPAEHNIDSDEVNQVVAAAALINLPAMEETYRETVSAGFGVENRIRGTLYSASSGQGPKAGVGTPMYAPGEMRDRIFRWRRAKYEQGHLAEMLKRTFEVLLLEYTVADRLAANESKGVQVDWPSAVPDITENVPYLEEHGYLNEGEGRRITRNKFGLSQ